MILQRKVAILGSGGREHALATKMIEEIGEENVFVLPGSSAIPRSFSVDPNNADHVAGFCELHGIDLVIVGPEGPLVNGIVDALQDRSVTAFGPKKIGAHLEGSKIFAKNFMNRHGVATASFREFHQVAAGEVYVRTEGGPCVIKFDGLAAGKGVFVCDNKNAALEALDVLRRENGEDVSFLIEERLIGKEISLIVITDGKVERAFPFAQDHKKLLDGECGPNTGGMGACTPVDGLTNEDQQRIKTEIVEPTLRGLREDNISFCGFLYFGVMLTPTGPKLLEYNVRLGDPEAQVLLASMNGPLLPYLDAAFAGQLQKTSPLPIKNAYFAGVVLAKNEYPLSPTKPSADKIIGLEKLPIHTRVYFGGSERKGDDFFAVKGRTLCLVSEGSTREEALSHVYQSSQMVTFNQARFRKDIGRNWHCPTPRLRSKIALFASGRGSNARAILENIEKGILAGRCEAPLLILDRPGCAAETLAQAYGIKVVVLDYKKLGREAFEDQVLSLLRKYDVDTLVLAGFMRLLSARIVNNYRGRILNIHPADPHAYRGPDGYGWAWRERRPSTKVTVHLVDEGMDTGPIMSQESLDLEQAKSLEDVMTKGLVIEHKLYSQTLADFLAR